jgi:hypothetical protein
MRRVRSVREARPWRPRIADGIQEAVLKEEPRLKRARDTEETDEGGGHELFFSVVNVSRPSRNGQSRWRSHSVLLIKVFWLALLVGLASGTATAVPIKWTLSGITFLDGGTVTGTFVYDADTNTYSSVSIITTATNPPTAGFVPGATYTAPHPPSGADVLYAITNPSLPDLTGTPVVIIRFAQVLTNAGGTTNVFNVAEGTCFSNSCTSYAGNSRTEAPRISEGYPSMIISAPAL